MFGIQRTPRSIKFYVDDELIGEAAPPDGGFWGLGQFELLNPGLTNIWADGTRMSPFNDEVSYSFTLIFVQYRQTFEDVKVR